MTTAQRFSLRWSAFLLVVVSCIFPLGCKEGPGTKEGIPEDPLERAKRITQLRREAGKWWDVFLRSEGSKEGPDIDALKRYAEILGETANVDPTACPTCFRDYGAALSRLGIYYQTLVAAMTNEHQTATGARRAELEGKIAKYTEAYKSYYRDAIKEYNTYLRSTTTAIDPAVYQAIVQMCVELEDWDLALYYLDYFVEDVPLTEEGKKYVRKLRRSLLRDQRLEREREEEARERARLPAEDRTEPAN